DPAVRDLLSQVLSDVGQYDTDIAADGVEGLERVRTSRYDIIFTDLTMPRMNGMDFLRKSKEIAPSTPVVVLTGVSSMEIAVAAMRKGACDFITKPFRLDKIVSTTERVLGEWKLYGRLASTQGSDDSLKRLNSELFKRLQEIGALHSISTEVDRCHDNKEIYSRVAEMGAKLLAVQEVSFGILEGKVLMVRSSVGIGKASFPVEGPFFDVVVSGRRHHVVDVGKPNPYTGAVLSSQLLSIPFLVGNEVFGILNLSGKADGTAFTEEEIYIAINLAKKIASRIENNALYEVFFNNIVATLKSLITTIGARDSYTKEHSERVTMLGLRVAEAMGLASEEIDTLRFGGYLHDIGKIGVRDTVLLKPGGLSEGEIQEIRLHSVIGDEIVKPIRFFDKERKVIRHHHERYDGQGYPDGARRDEIPTIARILAVADTYDAMTSHRPYRKALSAEAAVAELIRCAGTQFDPEIVRVFQETIKEEGVSHAAGRG
ncbi:MAG: response regulator receiver modulated metal dependent phosphohydrolase, partial [Deltaproteobacteria bacterium]|nr:response regulator receiver modulated metal dependent phosphohydrolase [Deltaproteobacteria bacterium]